MNDFYPPGWRKASISEIAEECNDRVGSENPIVLSSTKHYGLVPSDEYFGGRTIYSDNLSNYKLVRRNWFAYATNHLAEGSIGLQRDFKSACVSPIYTVFKCKENVDPEFLYRVLKSPHMIPQYMRHEQASVDRRGAVRFRDFSTISIPVPSSLSEQRRIADILDSADANIAASQSTIRKLESVTAALATSQLAEMSSNRRSVQLKDSGTWLSGGTPLTGDPRYWNGKIPWISAASLKDFHISRSDRCITELGAMSGTRLVPPGTVLFVVRGMSLKTEFRVGVTARQVAFGQDCKAILPAPGIDAKFLALALKARSREILSMVDEAGHGTGRLPTDLISTLTITLPELQDQQQIVHKIEVGESRIRCEEQKLKQLHAVRSGLMDDLLTGRVRVPGPVSAA